MVGLGMMKSISKEERVEGKVRKRCIERAV